MENTKQCIKCKKIKPILMFCKKSENKDGHDNRCKECYSNYQKEYARQKKEDYFF